MKTRWVIPAATVSAALLWPGDAHARTFTCWQSNTDNWTMEQPDADANAGYWPTWVDCEAWRLGDPGPQYVWSYGPSVATTTSVPATTTTEPSTTTSSTSTSSTTTTTSTTSTTTTTLAPAPASTTTSAPVQSSTTTTSAAPVSPTTTPYHDATSTTHPSTTQTIATIASTTSTSSSTTLLPVDPTPETIPSTTIVQTDARQARAAKIIGAQLAPGVTPLQAQSVLIVNVAMNAVSTISARRRNEK